MKCLHKNLFWFWIILIFLVNIIPFSASDLIPETSESLSLIFKNGYLLHALIMFTLPWMYYFLTKHQIVLFKINPIFKLIVLLIFLSIAAEFLQHFIPNRSFNLWDMVFNLAGGFVGLLIFIPLSKKKAIV